MEYAKKRYHDSTVTVLDTDHCPGYIYHAEHFRSRFYHCKAVFSHHQHNYFLSVSIRSSYGAACFDNKVVILW